MRRNNGGVVFRIFSSVWLIFVFSFDLERFFSFSSSVIVFCERWKENRDLDKSWEWPVFTPANDVLSRKRNWRFLRGWVGKYIVKLGRYNGKYLSRIVSIIEVWICSIQRIVIIETTRFWCISARRVDVLVSRWEQMKLKRSYLSSRWKMHLASQWHEKIQITSLLRITHPWTELLQ